MRTPPPVLPPEGTVPEYKHNRLDRGGPDAALKTRAMMYAVMVGTLVTVAILSAGAQGGKIGANTLLGALLAGGILGSLTGYTGLMIGQGASAVAKAVTLPSGKSTPYEEQFSYQESLEARDLPAALESWEAVIAERPGAAAPRKRAAELYAGRAANPQRAAELFREIRDLPDISSRDAVYAASRLVDLYDGPLNDPGRALVELRRIIELHPGTPLAAHAREALPRLKARLLAERGETPES